MEFHLDKTHPDYRGINDEADRFGQRNDGEPITQSQWLEDRMRGDIGLCDDCFARREISNAIDDAINMQVPDQFDPQPESFPIFDDQLPLWMKDQMFGTPYYDNEPL